MAACVMDCAATVSLLVESGASVNLIGSDGFSALDMADKKGLTNVASLLRAYGGCTGAEVRRAAAAAASQKAAAKCAAAGGAERVAIGEAAARVKGEALFAACRRAVSKHDTSKAKQDAAAAALRLIGEGADTERVDAVTGGTPLMLASCFGILDAVAARLIVVGAKLDATDASGSTALVRACACKRAATAMLLIEAGASLDLSENTRGATALDCAVAQGLASVTTALCALGGRSGAEIKAARELGERDTAARARLSTRARERASDQLFAACACASDKRETEGRRLSAVAAALQAIGDGADPDVVHELGGLTPLVFASAYEVLDAVSARLISAGAALDLVNEDGRSPLLSACLHRRTVTARLLIEAGSPLNLTSEGVSALDAADGAGLAYVAAAIRLRGGLTGAELRARAGGSA